MSGVTRDGRPGWDPEHDASSIAWLEEHILTIEDDYERWGCRKDLERLRAEHHRNCGRRWPEVAV